MSTPSKMLKVITQTVKGRRKHLIPPATSIKIGGGRIYAYTDTPKLYTEKEFNSFLKAMQSTTKLTVLILHTDFLTHLQQQDELVQEQDQNDSSVDSPTPQSYLQRFMNVLQAMKSLDVLEIRSGSRFHMDILAGISTNNTNRNSSSTTTASIFQKIIPCNLKVLKMDDLQVTATHKQSIIQGLANAMEDHPTLTHVTLHNFFANDYSNTQPGVLNPIIYMASTIPNLQKLEITGCGSHALTGQNVQLVSPHCLSNLLMKRSNTIETLILSFLEFRKEQFHAIATQLQQNKFNKLRVLHLNYHHLCKISFEQFMTTLSLAHVTIEDLELRSLSFIADEYQHTNQGYTQALKMLQQHNYNIQSLSVNTATKQQTDQLNLYLRLNIAGRKMLRNPSMTFMEWIRILESNSHDVDVTRHLLQDLPTLCQNAIATTSSSSNVSSNDGEETSDRDQARSLNPAESENLATPAA